jgi:hypothetical protein
MGIKQSHGFRSMNIDPSHGVQPKTGYTRDKSGKDYLSSYDEILDAQARVDGGSRFKKVELEHALNCPCCKQPVRVPSVEMVIDHYGVTPLEARILGAVWKGRGMPVMTERVFDAMYVDDPDGGPTPTKMYLAFKVALCHLREKLEGSGISIENVGYRRGYRLVLGN